MALPLENLTKDSIEQLYSVASDDKTRVGARKLVNLLNEMCGVLNRLYGNKVVTDIAVTDATDAGVSEFIGGGEGDALAVGDIFRTTGGTADLTDNALATAKGGAVASNDIFLISGADAVTYLGSDSSTSPRAFNFDGELDSDFDSIGS